MAEETEQTQHETQHMPTGHAEEAFEHAGEELGAFAVQTSQRLQSLFAQSIQTVLNVTNRSTQREAAEAPTAPERAPAARVSAEGAPAEAEKVSAAELRAEVLVDALGHRLGEWSHAADIQLRALWARVREEGEDILAEAQDVRRPRTT